MTKTTKTLTIKPISKKSFAQIKKIQDTLQKEVDYDKAHHITDIDDYDFGSLNDPDIGESQLFDDFDNNLDMMSATNFNLICDNENGVTVICYNDMDYPYDDSLCVWDVLGVIKKLVKLGRYGIAKRIKKNGERGRLINKLEDEMDLD